jgi:hypothetical protein
MPSSLCVVTRKATHTVVKSCIVRWSRVTLERSNAEIALLVPARVSIVVTTFLDVINDRAPDGSFFLLCKLANDTCLSSFHLLVVILVQREILSVLLWFSRAMNVIMTINATRMSLDAASKRRAFNTLEIAKDCLRTDLAFRVLRHDSTSR